MKRIVPLLTLVAALGCTKGTPRSRRLGASAPIATPGQTINFDPTMGLGLTAAVNTTVYDSGGAYLWIKYSVANTAWRPEPTSKVVARDPSQSPGLKAPVGFVVTSIDGTSSWVKSGTADTNWQTNPSSGGGSSYTPGTGIAIDGGVINNTAPVSSHYTLSAPNSSSQSVNTYEFLNDFSSNTAGSETSRVLITVPVNGTQTSYDLAKLNGAGKQVVTTSGSTPSVALLPRYGVFEVTIGADATSLTITGLDLDTDFHYQLVGDLNGTGTTSAFNMQVNGGASSTTGKGLYFTTSGNFGSSSNSITGADFPLCDWSDSGKQGTFVTSIIGAAGSHRMLISDEFVVQSTLPYMEHVTGYTVATTNIQSLKITSSTNTLKAGSTVSIERVRALAN